MMPRFDRCLAFVLAKEGGFNDIRADRGGATNFGISLRFARSLGHTLDLDGDADVDADDIRAITPQQAAAIYRDSFWRPLRADELPQPLDLLLFDSAVNCGVPRAARWVQSAAGAAADGVIGPRSLAAIRARPLRELLQEVLAQRITLHMRDGEEQRRIFGLGWARRCAALGVVIGEELSGS